MFIPEWLFKEKQTYVKKSLRKNNPKTLKQLAWDKSKIGDKESISELAKKR